MICILQLQYKKVKVISLYDVAKWRDLKLDIALDVLLLLVLDEVLDIKTEVCRQILSNLGVDGDVSDVEVLGCGIQQHRSMKTSIVEEVKVIIQCAVSWRISISL